MPEKPLVSIVTPLFNASGYIEETIESVINQTYQNWELIVVDDCSTDNSRELVKELAKKDKRIRLIESSENFGGPAKPRNIGIDNAKGDYISFLDADDVFLKEKLEKQLEIFNKNDDVDIVHTLAYTIDIDSNKTGVFKNQKILNKLRYFMKKPDILYLSNFINVNTSLMKNNFNTRFREDKYLIALEDWAFWIDNLHEGKQEYLLKEKLLNYRIDINSISDRGSDKSYRKAFYLYSLLLNENKISLKMFILTLCINSIKIIIKKLK